MFPHAFPKTITAAVKAVTAARPTWGGYAWSRMYFLHIVISISSELVVGKDSNFSYKNIHILTTKCKIQWKLCQRFSGEKKKVIQIRFEFFLFFFLLRKTDFSKMAWFQIEKKKHLSAFLRSINHLSSGMTAIRVTYFSHLHNGCHNLKCFIKRHWICNLKGWTWKLSVVCSSGI